MILDNDSFHARTRAARKIIAVNLGFLGDSVHLVPALWELRRHYPQAEIHTLTSAVGAEVFRLAPCVDRAWTLPLRPRNPRWWRQVGQVQGFCHDLFRGVYRDLRRERFDAAFNFNGSDRSIFTTRLVGARWSVARQLRRHFWNRWLIPEWIPNPPTVLLTFEDRLQLLAACGMNPGPARFDLRPSDADRQWAAENIAPGTIHLSINASTPLKEWPLEQWAQLAKRLWARHPGLRLVATASKTPREIERLRALEKLAGDSRLDCSIGLDIGRLCAMLERCQAHAGLDSGPLHLAMAMGIPTVSLFRQSQAMGQWAPSGPRHRQIAAPCSCLEQNTKACLALPHPRCMASITVEQVLETIQELSCI